MSVTSNTLLSVANLFNTDAGTNPSQEGFPTACLEGIHEVNTLPQLETASPDVVNKIGIMLLFIRIDDLRTHNWFWDCH